MKAPDYEKKKHVLQEKSKENANYACEKREREREIKMMRLV